MVIAFVSDAIWPYNKGGKEKRLFDISTRLAQKGHDVHIYTMKWWQGKSVIKESGVTLHAICKHYPLYSGSRRSIREGILFGLSCLKLITQKWDVIDVDHMPFFPLFSTKIICLIKRKKMIATWHEVWGENYWKKYLGKLGNLASIIEKLSIALPDKIISVSDLTTNNLNRKNITTIPDGIDFDHIQEIKSATTKSDVIFAGRLLSHKNIDVLIKSISILKTKCIIIGDGPEKVNLEKLVSKLNLSKYVKFLGFIENHDEVLSYIKSSKIFILPSEREGFGIVAIEANACGVPVVTIDHPSNAAKDLIVDGKNGYVCRLDPSDIAKKISNNICQKQTCIDAAKKYGWKNIMKKIEGVYLQ